jgi:hypothetical protein
MHFILQFKNEKFIYLFIYLQIIWWQRMWLKYLDVEWTSRTDETFGIFVDHNMFY